MKMKEIKKKRGKLLLIAFLLVPFFYSKTRAGTYTIRGTNGALLLQGEVEALQKIKKETESLPPLSVEELYELFYKEKGLQEIALFYDPAYFYALPQPGKEKKMTVQELRSQFHLVEENPFFWIEQLTQSGYQVFFEGFLPFSLFIKSAGAYAGNKGEIWLEGKQVAKGGRGLNAVVLDSATFEIKANDVFDTNSSPSEARRFLLFLKNIKAGDYLLIAAKDEAGRFFDNEVFHALSSLFGAKQNLTRRKHYAYILVSQKNARAPLFEAMSHIKLQVFLPKPHKLPPFPFSGMIFFHGFTAQDEVILVE